MLDAELLRQWSLVNFSNFAFKEEARLGDTVQ